MNQNFRFLNPFTRNHCVVLAFAHAADLDAAGARVIAEKARLARVLTPAGIALRSRTCHFVKWCKWAGLPSTGSIVIPHMTLETFARLHPRGRWIVWVAYHTVALIDGTIYGSYKPRSRVQIAREVSRP